MKKRTLAGTAETAIHHNHRGVVNGPALDSDDTYKNSPHSREANSDQLRKTQKIGTLREAS